jgi:hypothetical protein
MILMMLVIVALLGWLFFAQVTLFTQSNRLSLTDSGRLLATFPKESIVQIKPGQAALLRLRSDPNEKSTAIPALVFSIDTQNNQAEIVLLGENIPPELAPGDIQGEVSVEVNRVTPISLVLQALGYRVAQREVPVSPQSFEEFNP